MKRAATGAVPLLLAAILLLPGCRVTQSTPLPTPAANSLRLVSSLPQGALYARQTTLIRQAIAMAVDEYRSRLPAWSVQHIALDDGSEETGEWSEEREQANALAAGEDGSVIAYIGPYNSGAAMQSMPMLNRAGLLQMLPSATWPGLTEAGWESGEPVRYYPTGRQTMVRAMPPDSRQAWAAADWAAELGGKSALVVDDGSSYSEGMAQAFIRRAASTGTLRVVATAKLGEPGGRMSTTPADTVYFAPSSTEKATQLARLLEETRRRTGVFVSDVALSDQLTEEALRSIDGWHVTFNGATYPPQTDKSRAFAAAFQSRYGALPTQFAANAYDLASLALDAVVTSGRDREAVLNKVMQTQGYEGAGGEISFLPSGDTARGIIGRYVVRGGKFVLIDEREVQP